MRTSMFQHSYEHDDPCCGCKFAQCRPDRFMFERFFVCKNEKRINDIVDRCKILLDAGRLKEACHLLEKAVIMKSSYDNKSFIEPDESSFTPYCFEKEHTAQEKEKSNVV